MPEGRILLSKGKYRELRTKVEKLRRRGLSYKEIRKYVPVSRSTLSAWCQPIPLTPEQKLRISGLRPNIFLGAKANHEKSVRLKQAARNAALAEIGNPTFETLKTAGALLYWAEGSKANGTAISNSDPVLIVFMVQWFNQILAISPHDLSAHLHLHKGQDEMKEKEFWSDLTEIPLINFRKSFIKPIGTGHRKNILYHGTIRISVLGHGPELLRHRILGWAQAVARSYVPQEVIDIQYRSRMGR